MKPPPKGWPRMTISVFYDDPHAAIDWLVKAFNFEVRLKVESDDGVIQYSELTFGESMISVGGVGGEEAWQKLFRSPKSVGGVTQTTQFFVDDCDTHHARAKAAGARIIREPRTTDYGDDYWVDRTYGALDPEGHIWWFMQRVSEKK
jgi:uncharacterized glyoxalase superfamily protein PhnB